LGSATDDVEARKSPVIAARSSKVPPNTIISLVGRPLPWSSLVDSEFSGARSTPGHLRLIDCKYSLNSFGSGLVGVLVWFGSNSLIRLVGARKSGPPGSASCLPTPQADPDARARRRPCSIRRARPGSEAAPIVRRMSCPSVQAHMCRPDSAARGSADRDESRKCHARSAAISRRTGEFTNPLLRRLS
jgi:hypothetical protein